MLSSCSIWNCKTNLPRYPRTPSGPKSWLCRSHPARPIFSFCRLPTSNPLPSLAITGPNTHGAIHCTAKCESLFTSPRQGSEGIQEQASFCIGFLIDFVLKLILYPVHSCSFAIFSLDLAPSSTTAFLQKIAFWGMDFFRLDVLWSADHPWWLCWKTVPSATDLSKYSLQQDDQYTLYGYFSKLGAIKSRVGGRHIPSISFEVFGCIIWKWYYD